MRSEGVSYDVIIIGAGVSGLTAGALLARAGLGVCVVEEQPEPGGFLQGFTRGGFTFDTSVQWLNGMDHGGMSGRVLDHLGDERPVCPPLHRFQRYRGQSFDYLLTTEPDLMRDALAADFPGERDGVHRMFDDAREFGRRMRKLHSLARAFETMSPLGKMVRGLSMLFWYLGIRRYVRPGIEEGLARYVKDPDFARIFIAEEKLNTIITPMAWAYEGDLFAAPRGGSRVLVDWMVRKAAGAGAEILFGELVEEVLLEGGRVAGVRCASGKVARAPHVICASDVDRLYNRLLPLEASPEKLRRRLRDADLYYSSLTLFLGLSCDPGELGLGPEQVLLTRDDVPRAEQMVSGPARSAITVMAPSARDSSLAPEGKGTVVIHCPAWLEDHERWGTGPGLERGEAYRRVKKEQGKIAMERVERDLCPGLSSKVELLSAATPVTYQRYTRNREGVLLGTRATDKNIKARVAHYLTPVKGLLLAGHWAEYSGGVPMAIKAGANTSLMVLQKVKREAFKQLRDVLDAK